MLSYVFIYIIWRFWLGFCRRFPIILSGNKKINYRKLIFWNVYYFQYGTIPSFHKWRNIFSYEFIF